MDFGMDQETNSYRVEISGWDASDQFFVEHSMLEWGPEERKEVSLRGVVREGCVVFVRLLQPKEDSDNFPIACQVVKVKGKDAEGRTLVQLEQLRPRAFFKQTARELNHSAIRVA
jgi:hypothetical protein